MNLGWSNESKKKIREIKISILRRKIMLIFMIDIYEWWDKIYRWIHIIIASCSPLLGVYQSITEEEGGDMRSINIMLGCLVTAMLKIREYVMFDKICLTAKEQSVKYTQLYERIEAEKRKPDNKKQIDDEFIYWINREFSFIEINDPEMSRVNRLKFEKMCIKKGIPYDEDLEQLQKLLKQGVNDSVKNINDVEKDVEIDVEKFKREFTGVDSIIDEKTLLNVVRLSSMVDESTLREITGINSDDSTMEELNNNVPELNNNVPELNNNVPELNNNVPELNRMSINKNTLSESDEKNINEYKNKIKNIDTKADMIWALERLENIK